jgi:hypothetical protein
VVTIIYLLFLMLILPAAADAAQLGRITEEVNFRDGPSRSAPRIGRLAAGVEVEVIKREPAGWYFIVYRGHRGYVHQNYIAVKAAPTVRTRLGFILILAGGVLIALYFFPIAPRVATFLLLSFAGVLLLDAGFHFGMLYSLFFISLGLLLVLVFLSRKEKKKADISEKVQDVFRKAA